MKSFEEVWSNRRADVEQMARVIVRRFGGWEVLDDLVAAGKVGLLQAYRRYDPSRSTVFWRGFAEVRVRGAMYDELRSMDHVGRGGREAVSKDGNEAVPAWGLWQKDRHYDLDEASGEEDLEASLSSAENRGLVVEAVSRLPARLQDVVRWYYYGSETLDAIAGRLGVTEGRVCQLKHEALRGLREVLSRCSVCGDLQAGRAEICEGCRPGGRRVV